MRSLLKQLIYQSDIPNLLSRIYDLRLSKGGSAEPDTQQLMEILIQVFEEFSIVYILIDAFDECRDDQRPPILKALQSLPSSKLRLFLTGRTYIFESRELRDDELWLKRASYQPIRAHQDDVERYLNEELDKRARGLNLRAEIVDKIKTNADGQYFPYVRL